MQGPPGLVPDIAGLRLARPHVNQTALLDSGNASSKCPDRMAR